MPGPTPAARHWSSLVQAPHLKVPVVVSQMGVLPEQSVLVWQPTHWPALELVVLVLRTQMGVAPVHGPVAPPSGAPPSVELAPATTESQPFALVLHAEGLASGWAIAVCHALGRNRRRRRKQG